MEPGGSDLSCSGSSVTSTVDAVFAHGSIGKAFRKACATAGIKGVTPHTLRHTFASRFVMSGADLRTVQELGEWQTIAMVERYSHLSPQHKARAIERLAEFPSLFSDEIAKGIASSCGLGGGTP